MNNPNKVIPFLATNILQMILIVIACVSNVDNSTAIITIIILGCILIFTTFFTAVTKMTEDNCEK